MDRLHFLKTFGLTLGGGLLAKQRLLAVQAPESAPGTEQFKPGPGGQILVNRPGSTGWDVHADFGSRYEVLAVRQERQGTHAELRFQGHDIRLELDPRQGTWVVR